MNMENLKFRLRLIVRQILRVRVRVRLRRVHKASIPKRFSRNFVDPTILASRPYRLFIWQQP